MNKSNKIIASFYVFLAFSYGVYVLISSEGLEYDLFEGIIPKKITDFETSRLVDVNNERIFNVMSDVENFPNIIPKNIISIQILNKTENVILAEEELVEAGIKIKMLVKHTINPFNEHVIEIIDGDAKGTTISQSFESIDSQTNLITKVHLNVRGVATLIAFLPESSLIHATNTVISYFVDYSKYDVYQKKVDTLYNEILNRPADQEGLSHFSNLLRTGKITEEELRSTLFNSPERASMEMKSIEELSDETKKIIDELYEKILLRKADPAGMRYFGNLLENGTRSDEIRTILLESDEGKDVSVFHPIRSEIKVLYRLFFDRLATDDEINYYHKLIDDGLMTLNDVKIELEQSEEYANLDN